MSTIEKTVTLNDLKDGDVLVMQGPQSWKNMSLNLALDKAIMWLTNSDVCHGALYYGVLDNMHYLIDDGMKGVGQHSMTQGEGEALTWYVRRPTGVENLQPVLEVANKYKNSSTAYDWELLVMLGMLLLYKKMTPNTLYYRYLLKVLQKIVVTIDNETHGDDTRYFVCSQFVAMCFSEAGEQFALDVVNGSFQANANSQSMSLIDHCIDNSNKVSADGVLEAESVEPLTADDIKQLIEAYEQSSDQSETLESMSLASVVNVSDDFLGLFFTINGSAMGLEKSQWDSPEKRFALAKKYQDDFVTPADLKSHCKNLDEIGMISFVYGA